MIHKACMPVYMNSGKIVADGTGGRDGTGGESKVLQEVLADLKKLSIFSDENWDYFMHNDSNWWVDVDGESVSITIDYQYFKTMY